MICVEGPEVIAAAPKSATGEYLKPLLEREFVKSVVVVGAPKQTARAKKTRPIVKNDIDGVDEDELDFETAR